MRSWVQFLRNASWEKNIIESLIWVRKQWEHNSFKKSEITWLESEISFDLFYWLLCNEQGEQGEQGHSWPC